MCPRQTTGAHGGGDTQTKQRIAADVSGTRIASHLIIVLVVVLLLFGAKRIPELAKGLGTGVKELREGFSTGEDAAESGAHESVRVRGETPHDGSGDGTVQTVGARARQRGL